MTELLSLPPPPEAIAAMAAIPRSRLAPVVLGTQQGPEGHLGPETAGAILMLQATFTNPEGSAAFWQALVPLFGLLESAPGFIRRYGFNDGPHNTLIAFWRTADDARAFAASGEHRTAVRDLYREHWQYNHFAAIWEMTTSHDRVTFCPSCATATPPHARAVAGAERNYQTSTRRSRSQWPG